MFSNYFVNGEFHFVIYISLDSFICVTTDRTTLLYFYILRTYINELISIQNVSHIFLYSDGLDSVWREWCKGSCLLISSVVLAAGEGYFVVG
jgi:hypothetical protein